MHTNVKKLENKLNTLIIFSTCTFNDTILYKNAKNEASSKK